MPGRAMVGTRCDVDCVSVVGSFPLVALFSGGAASLFGRSIGLFPNFPDSVQHGAFVACRASAQLWADTSSSSHSASGVSALYVRVLS